MPSGELWQEEVIKMPFLGTIVNFFAVLACGIVGSLVKSGIPKRIEKTIMSAMAICVIYIGISGMLESAPSRPSGALFDAGLIKVLIMILSMVVGTVIGEVIDIDKWLGRLGAFLEKKFAGGKGGGKVADCDTQELDPHHTEGNFARGFVSCSLLFCVGAMAVNGAIADAMGDPNTLLAKSVIDAISCFVMASSFGIGCAFSAVVLLVYQGGISALALWLIEVLPAATITYMSVTGSLVIVLIGTNMLGCTKVKTANMMLSIFMPIAIAPLVCLLP